MTAIDKLKITRAATSVLRSLWQERRRIWANPPNADGLLPIPVDKIARDLLGLSLEEPEEILFANSADNYEVAGFLDRGERRIVVAQKFRPEWRRFTLAHEVAHWILHPKITHHRDRPLTGGERANQTRPKEEQEADVFAAELVMPEKPLRKKVRLRIW
jgi:Zn-dependent peptidase ImmA (M78 family)